MERCAECNGQGSITTTWDFGASVTETCTFCGGSGSVPASMFLRSPAVVPVTKEILGDRPQNLTDVLNEALVEVYKRRIEKNLFQKSPLLKAYKGKSLLVQEYPS